MKKKTQEQSDAQWVYSAKGPAHLNGQHPYNDTWDAMHSHAYYTKICGNMSLAASLDDWDGHGDGAVHIVALQHVILRIKLDQFDQIPQLGRLICRPCPVRWSGRCEPGQREASLAFAYMITHAAILLGRFGAAAAKQLPKLSQARKNVKTFPARCHAGLLRAIDKAEGQIQAAINAEKREQLVATSKRKAQKDTERIK